MTVLRTAAVTTVASWAGRLAQAGLQLVALRLLADALGLEPFAAYALVAALQGWYLLLDLGVGASLQNFVSERLARGLDPEPAVRSGLQLLALSGAGGALLSLLAAPLTASLYLGRLAAVPEAERIRAAALGGVLLVGGMLAQVAQQLWFARRRGWVAIAVLTGAHAAAVGALLALRQAGPEEPLLPALLAALGPQALAGLALLLAGGRGSLGRLGAVDREAMRALLGRGLRFWGFALLAAAVLQLDALVLSQLGTAGQIATYSAVSRLYALPLMLVLATWAALWPAFAELHAAGRAAEAARLVRRLLLLGSLPLLAGLAALGWALEPLLGVLAPRQGLHAGPWLPWAFGAYVLLRFWTDGWGTLLQGWSDLRPLYVLAPAQALVALVAEALLLPRYGLPGLVAGLALSFAVTVAWGLPAAVRRRLRRQAAAVTRPGGAAPPAPAG